MADNKLNLLVKFTGIDKLSGSIRNIMGAGNKGAAAMRALRTQVNQGKSAISGLNKQIRDNESELARVRDLLRSGSMQGGLALAERELVSAIGEANRKIREQETAMAATNRQIDTQKTKLERIGNLQKRAGQVAKTAGIAGAAITASVTAPFVLMAQGAATFSSGMVDIQQKAELTDKATDQLTNRIIVMSSAAKQLPEDMRSGMDALLAKGMGIDAASAAMTPIGKLATAYKVDIPDAANATFAALSNLKIGAGDTTRVLDTMAAAGNAGGFEMSDMARAFPALTAQMQALGAHGVPAVADLSAALQVAMHTAGNADQAGTNIQNLLAKINAPDTVSAFKKNFGIDLPAAMKKLTDQGYSALEAITMLTQKATGGDTKKLGYAFGDQQARMGILAMIQNLDEYRKIRASAMHAGGTVDTAFNQRAARDATVQWRDFTGTASRFAIIFGTSLLPMLTLGIRYLSQMASSFGTFAQAHPALTKFAVGFMAVLGVLGPVLIGVAAVASAVGTLAPMILGIGGAFMAALPVVGGAIGALVSVIGLPLLAVVAAVAGVGYLVYSNWAKIQSVLIGGIRWLKSSFAALPAWMQNIGTMMMHGLLIALNPALLVSKLLSVAKSGLTAFKNYFGIHSPSRLFMEMGGHINEGLGLGLERGQGRPVRAVGRMASAVAGAGAMALAPAAAPARGAPPARAEYHFHITQMPGENSEALARRLADLVKKAHDDERRRDMGDDF